LDGAEQVFEVATRRLFVLVARSARGDTSWDALAADELAEVATVLALLRDASGAGSAEASNVLGVLHYTGRGVAADDAEARQHWSRAAFECAPPSAAALFNLSVATKEGRGGSALSGGPRDQDAAAFALALRAAELGYPEAQSNLGKMLELGDGCPTNAKEAVKWTLRAAEQGSAPAQARMAAYCNTGYGQATKPGGKGGQAGADPAQAVMWLQLAAAGGDATAAAAVGACYEAGHGVAQCDEDAVRWFTRAADAGDATGQFKLGCMYVQEKGMRAARVGGATFGGGVRLSGGDSALVGPAAEPLRVAHALACFVAAAEQGHVLAQQLAQELRAALPAHDALATPAAATRAGADPAAKAWALAEAATQAADQEAATTGAAAPQGNGSNGDGKGDEKTC
jgi:TPR repeat protein